MRWRVLMAGGILAVILLGGLWCRQSVETHCSRVEALLMEGRETGEADCLVRAGTLWESRIGMLSALVNHEQLEAVGQGITLAAGLLERGETAAGRAQIDAVLYLLDDIREYDHINPRTLL